MEPKTVNTRQCCARLTWQCACPPPHGANHNFSILGGDGADTHLLLPLLLLLLLPLLLSPCHSHPDIRRSTLSKPSEKITHT